MGRGSDEDDFGPVVLQESFRPYSEGRVKTPQTRGTGPLLVA